MARRSDLGSGASVFAGSRRHGMDEGPLLAFREAVQARTRAKYQASQARAAAAAKRSPKDQLARLDALLGKGKGAVRERARIARALKGR